MLASCIIAFLVATIIGYNIIATITRFEELIFKAAVNPQKVNLFSSKISRYVYSTNEAFRGIVPIKVHHHVHGTIFNHSTQHCHY